jgi:hypothetical protein
MLSFDRQKTKKNMIPQPLQLLRISPSEYHCPHQPSWQDVREYSYAFSKGLGQLTVLEGDPYFADTFKPLFHSISHDMGLEDYKVPLAGSLNHVDRFGVFNYEGSLKRLRFQTKALRLTEFKTSADDPKNVFFSGYFKDFKVSFAYILYIYIHVTLINHVLDFCI